VLKALQLAYSLNFGKAVLLGQALNFKQTCIATDWFGRFSDQLHAIVVLGIMTRGHNNTAVHFEMRSGEVDFLRPAFTDVKYINATIQQTINQGIAQRRTGEPNIMPYYYSFGL